MNVGMLWFDNDSKTDLATKIERAVEYYHQKYGKRPNLCYIHPSMAPPLPEGDQAQSEKVVILRNGNIEVRTSRSVLPNHFWIGVNGSHGQANS